MAIDQAEAVRVLASATGTAERSIRAARIGGTELWSVGQLDEQGRPLAGAMSIVGPDGRLWTFSSNPSIHDPNLVVGALARLYDSDATQLVELDRLADRIRHLTDERQTQLRAIVRDAQAGELRTPPARRLP
jgi:hypothetical protein